MHENKQIIAPQRVRNAASLVTLIIFIFLFVWFSFNKQRYYNFLNFKCIQPIFRLSIYENLIETGEAMPRLLALSKKAINSILKTQIFSKTL